MSRYSIQNIENNNIKEIFLLLDILKKSFFIEKLSNTQIQCNFNIESIYYKRLPEDWKNNIYNKTFILDTSKTGLSTINNIGGLCDGVVLRHNNFYSVYAFFDDFYNFMGLGLYQCNKSTIGGAVSKSNSSQIIPISGITNIGNLWSNKFVPITIYKNTSQWLIGEAKYYDSNNLEIINVGDYGFAIVNDVNDAYIYQITDNIKQIPLNINNELSYDNWLWLTSGIRIDGSGNIQGFVYVDNSYKIDSVTPQVDTYASSYTVFNLLEYISPSTKFNELSGNVFTIEAGSIGEIITSVYYKNIRKNIEGFFQKRELSPCNAGVKYNRRIEMDNGLLQTYTSTNGTGATGSRIRWIVSYQE